MCCGLMDGRNDCVMVSVGLAELYIRTHRQDNIQKDRHTSTLDNQINRYPDKYINT